MTALTDAELAGLDLIIEMKKAGRLPLDFINNIVNDVNNAANNVANVANAVSAVTVATAAVAAVAAGAAQSPATTGSPLAKGAITPQTASGSGLSLDTLLNIRKEALDARKAAGKP